MSAVLRGIFPVLQTAVDDDDGLDVVSLRKQVDFCVEAGAHGLVYPVLGSEFPFLSQAERHQMAAAVVDQAGGRRRARDIFNQLLPVINLTLALGLPVCKEVLVRRDVFSSARQRTPGGGTLDEGDHRELDIILDDLRPQFKV